jgi:hypothetical protein
MQVIPLPTVNLFEHSRVSETTRTLRGIHRRSFEYPTVAGDQREREMVSFVPCPCSGDLQIFLI